MKNFFMFLGVLVLPFAAMAQSSKFIDAVLDSKAISGGEAAYLVLVASNNIGDDADTSRAFELLDRLGWVPSGLTSDTSISCAEYSYLLMRAFGLSGGIMYSLFPSTRYAYRELKYMVVIQGMTDPEMRVSGVDAMRMIGRVFDVKGVK